MRAVRALAAVFTRWYNFTAMAMTTKWPHGLSGSSLSAPSTGAGWLTTELNGLPESERKAALASHLQEQVASILQFGDPRGLDPNRPLFEVGLTSVGAMKVRDALSNSLATALPATLLFDHPTISALTSSLAQQILGLPSPEPTAPASSTQRLMDEIE